MLIPKRRTGNPQKQLLFMWMQRDLDRVGHVPAAVDIGCAGMINRALFHTDQYIGVDLDGPAIERGCAEHPGARGIVAPIEDMPDDVAGDVVVCSQMLGINVSFDQQNLLGAVRILIDAVKPGGALLFNISGPLAGQHGQQVHDMLAAAFAVVERSDYGRLDIRTGRVRALLHAWHMHLRPSARLGAGPPTAYFACFGKRAPDGD